MELDSNNYLASELEEEPSLIELMNQDLYSSPEQRTDLSEKDLELNN